MNPDIARHRLAAQSIAGERMITPLAVVRWLCALQAQDFHQMQWALGSRMEGGSVHDVADALATGEIARCWAVRGTMHLVAGEDVGWMTALDSEKRIRADRRRMDQIGLTDADIERAGVITEGLLRSRGWLKRSEIMAAWEDAGVITTGQRGYHALFHLAMRGMICIGPQIEKEQGVGLCAEVLPPQRKVEGDEARAEIALRYLRSHGPASINDFVWWTGWTKVQAQRAIADNGHALESRTVEGVEYWFTEDIADRFTNAADPFLLAGFDEFLIAYRDRSAVLDAAHAGKVVPGGNGIFQPFVVDRGAVVALWKRTVRRDRVKIQIGPFVADDTLQERARTQMERFAAFHGLLLDEPTFPHKLNPKGQA